MLLATSMRTGPHAPPPQGNYQGAANAYTQALLAEPPHPVPLLANRAACYLKAGDAARARDDCSAALELVAARLKRLEEAEAGGGAPPAGPPRQQQVEETAHHQRALLVKLLARRAAAEAQLRDLRGAEGGLLEALK
jgi:tetratricopeptide (TPR) repeat protein